jgi:thioredoxin reductase (NADPH)
MNLLYTRECSQVDNWTTSKWVENWPGNPEGITGPEMMVVYKQAQRFGTDVRDGWATK